MVLSPRDSFNFPPGKKLNCGEIDLQVAGCLKQTWDLLLV